MSNLIFPSLPGVTIGVRRAPVHSTDVQTSKSGREYRASWFASPRYKYELSFNFVRSAAMHREFQQLANFLCRHGGKYDTFLFQDPEDSAVSDHGFGVGTGSATAFQLQRTLGVTVQDVLGTWPQYTAPRRNSLLWSQDVSNAAWTKNAGGTGSAPVVTANYAEAPDGTITADLVKFRLNGGTANGDHSNLSQAVTTQVGRQYAGSIWLKTADGSSKVIIVEPGSGVAAATVTVTGTWQRFTAPWLAASAFGALYVRLRGTPLQTADSADLLVWGGQYEPDAVLATKYIPTTSAALTQTPAFWPNLGDGFEPVYDPAPGLQLFLTDWQGKRALYPYSRTNLFLRSQEFDNAAWTKSNATITANAIAAPDGTTTADKLVENSATSEHKAYQAIATADNAIMTLACWAKAGERTKVLLYFQTKAGTFPGVRFDLAAGTVDNLAGGAVGTITAYPDGWYRCTASASMATGGSSPTHQILVVGPGNATSYLGDGTSGLYVWGAQLENPPTGNAATPYIPTTTAAVTVTDYTGGANGAVTLSPAPISGAALSWTGTYYRRLRLDEDETDFERIFNQIWEARSLSLISVRP